MNYIKILILFSAVFCMETFGMAYIQRKDLLCEKPLSDRIKISLSNDAKTKDFLWINASNRAFAFHLP